MSSKLFFKNFQIFLRMHFMYSGVWFLNSRKMKEIFKWNESLRNDFLSLKVNPTQDVLNGAEIGCELFCLGISKSKVWDWYSVELPWKLDSKFNLSSLWIMESRRRRRRLKNWLLFLLPERLLELVHSVEMLLFFCYVSKFYVKSGVVDLDLQEMPI